MTTTHSSYQSSPNDAEIGRLFREIEKDQEKIQEIEAKLRRRSKEFLELAKVIDPDTGGFGPQTTSTRFFKRIVESPPKEKEYSIPDDVGDLIYEYMKLGRRIEQNEKEMERLKT